MKKNADHEYEIPKDSRSAIDKAYSSYLEALRNREENILAFLTIIGPSLGGFVWLLYQYERGRCGDFSFTVGCSGILLLLFLGAAYALELGYSYRCRVVALAKLETVLGIAETAPRKWHRRLEDFNNKCYAWDMPPGTIKIFWIALIVGMVGVTIVAVFFSLCNGMEFSGDVILFVGLASLLMATCILPLHHCHEFHCFLKKESQPDWDKITIDETPSQLSVKILKP